MDKDKSLIASGQLDRLDPALLDRLEIQATRPLAEKTVESYKSDLKAFNEWLGEKGARVSKDSLVRYFLEMSRQLDPASLNRKKYALLKAVQAACKSEAERAVMTAAIKQAIPTYKTDKSVDPEEVLSKEEVERLIALARKRSEKLALIVEFLWKTGVRISELIKIRTKDLTIRQKVTIRIRGKGKKERRVKIPIEFYERITETFAGTERLFETRSGNPYHRVNLYKQLQAIPTTLPRNPHVFRHSRATWMIEQGFSLKAVSRFLGHSTTAITADLYIHDDVDYDRLFELDEEG